VRIARGGDILAPGDGRDPVQFIDARDLAEWTIRMVESRTFGVFNATGPASPLSMRDMLAGIAAAQHIEPQLTFVPAKFLAAQDVSAWGDMPVWVPAEGDSAGFARRDIRRALVAGLRFRTLAMTSGDTLAWFRTLPADRQAKLRAGIAPSREAEVLAAWRAAHGKS
jgi:2'-hydroxyisoflavone reductase